MKVFEKTFCIYIDLLGFSNLVSNDLKNNKNTSFEKIIEIIENFKDGHFEGDRARLNYLSFYSDSIIWIFSTYDDSNHTNYPCEFDACMSKIDGQLFFLLVELIQNGFFFRGGIASGKTIISNTQSNNDGVHFITENILFSESLVNAASIEKNISYPVIGLASKDLLNTLDDNGYGVDYIQEFDFVSKISDFEKQPPNVEDIYFLDYLEILVKNFCNEDEIHTLYDCLDNHKKQIIKQTGSTENENILKKYHFLLKYHNSKIKKILKVSQYEEFENLIIKI